MDAVTYRRMEKAIRYLQERRPEQPSLSDLADHVGLSEFHLQRTFRQAVGLSPKRFLQFLTAAEARQLLDGSGSLLEVAWEAGLSGPGRLHDLMVNVHAMTPGEVRGGGEGASLTWGVVDGPLGPMVVASTDRGICLLEFLEEGTDAEARTRLDEAWPRARHARDDDAARRSVAPLLHDAPEGAVHLHLRGTNFQIRVWEALLTIPPGAVTTYGALARRIGAGTESARAVGGAVARNPVAVLIPCHRVVRSTGGLGGYRWGRSRKLALLAREAGWSDRESA